MSPRQSITIEAGGGGTVRLDRGQVVRVVDVEGVQVADVFAFVADDPTEHLSAPHTRGVTDRLFPTVGQAFVTNRRRPILRFVADDSPGIHDMLIAACDPERYRLLGVEGHHRSCQETLLEQAAASGIAPIVVPQSVNVFMNIPVADGALSWAAAVTKPGDSVSLQAELDCWIVVSACPQDIVAINGHEPTPIRLEILDG